MIVDIPDALLAAVNEVMAEQETFLVHGTFQLAEKLGDSEEIFSSALFRGGQDPEGGHWLDLDIRFDTDSLQGRFESETRELAGVTYDQDPATGLWEIDEPDDEFDTIDAVLNGEIVLADTISEEIDGGYVITGTVPADPLVEIVTLRVRKADFALERVVIRTEKPREDYEALIGPGDSAVIAIETWRLADYGAEIVDVLAPTDGLVTTSTEFADGLMSLQIPNDWEKASLAELAELGLVGADAWASPDGLILMVLVEDLADLGFGSVTLEEYVDLTISFVISEESIISERVDSTSVQALPVTFLTGSADGTDLLPFSRFFYVHDESIALNITVLAPREIYAENADLVGFLINTLLVNDPPLG